MFVSIGSMIGTMRCERVDDCGFKVPDERTLRAGIKSMLYAISSTPAEKVDIDRVLPFYVEHWLHRPPGECDQILLLGALVDSGQCEAADAFVKALPNIFESPEDQHRSDLYVSLAGSKALLQQAQGH